MALPSANFVNLSKNGTFAVSGDLHTRPADMCKVLSA
jgi:hypothetical protein